MDNSQPENAPIAQDEVKDQVTLEVEANAQPQGHPQDDAAMNQVNTNLTNDSTLLHVNNSHKLNQFQSNVEFFSCKNLPSTLMSM